MDKRRRNNKTIKNNSVNYKKETTKKESTNDEKLESTLFSSNDIPKSVQQYLDRDEVVEETTEEVKTEEEVVEPQVVEDNVIVSEPKRNNGYYFSFNARFLANIIVLVILLGSFIYTLVTSFSTTTSEVIKYNVNSDIDYKVHLKPNDFYDEDYLDKGMLYVASLIDKINVNFKYNFSVDKASDIDFTYKVMAKLVIANTSNTNVFFEKEYELTKESNDEIIGGTGHTINEEYVLDYVYYNTLANKFRSNYAVNTVSHIDVYLVVNEKSKENNSYDLKNESKVILSIPLSQQEVNISLSNKDINETKELVFTTKETMSAQSIFALIILFIFLVIVCIELVKKILLLTKKRSKYDSYINRILRGYDRIIVSVKTMPNFEKHNIIKVTSFQELVDVRDNLKLPINYFIITNHQKSEFFVIDNKNIYLYVVKAVDLDGDNNEKEIKTK